MTRFIGLLVSIMLISFYPSVDGLAAEKTVTPEPSTGATSGGGTVSKEKESKKSGQGDVQSRGLFSKKKKKKKPVGGAAGHSQPPEQTDPPIHDQPGAAR
jgi:hypothetical protein